MKGLNLIWIAIIVMICTSAGPNAQAQVFLQSKTETGPNAPAWREGNIGIGTKLPKSKLYVQNGSFVEVLDIIDQPELGMESIGVVVTSRTGSGFNIGTTTIVGDNRSSNIGTRSYSIGNNSYNVAYYGRVQGRFDENRAMHLEAYGGNSINIGLYSEAKGTGKLDINAGAVLSGYGTLGKNYGLIAQAGGGYNLAALFYGNVMVTGRAYVTSDMRLKKDIRSFSSDVLEKLDALETKTYYFKENDNLELPVGKQIGWLAQDVEKIFPELVLQSEIPDIAKLIDGTREYTEVKAIDYVGFIPILTEAVKELERKQLAEISRLDKALEERDDEISDLRSYIRNLENSVDRMIGLLEDMDCLPEGTLKDVKPTSIIPGSAYMETNSKLGQNIPNPFSVNTYISYEIGQDVEKAELFLINMSGEIIMRRLLSDRNSVVNIDGSGLSDGNYLYKLIVDGKVFDTKRMILIR